MDKELLDLGGYPFRIRFILDQFINDGTTGDDICQADMIHVDESPTDGIGKGGNFIDNDHRGFQ